MGGAPRRGPIPFPVPAGAQPLIVVVAVSTLAAVVYLFVAWHRYRRAREGAGPPAPISPTRGKTRRPTDSAPPRQRKKPPAEPEPEHWLEDHTLDHRRQWVQQRVLFWWAVAVDAHATDLHPPPDVKFSSRLRHALGWADSSRNLINISDHHLMDKPKPVADQTVAHEVAHIFADRHHGKPCRHSKKWKQVMIAMGQRPDVCYRPEPEHATEQA